jgi:hypothetical protein
VCPKQARAVSPSPITVPVPVRRSPSFRYNSYRYRYRLPVSLCLVFTLVSPYKSKQHLKTTKICIKLTEELTLLRNIPKLPVNTSLFRSKLPTSSYGNSQNKQLGHKNVTVIRTSQHFSEQGTLKQFKSVNQKGGTETRK